MNIVLHHNLLVDGYLLMSMFTDRKDNPKQVSGPLYCVLGRVLRDLVGKKITVPGSFKTYVTSMWTRMSTFCVALRYMYMKDCLWEIITGR